MYALGIDFGERRIGLAVSDPEGRYALPLDAVERDTDRRAVYRIVEIARSRGVETLVVGEPRGLEGGDHPAAERVRRFAAKLERATRLPVVWVGEALTTVEASARLRAAGAAAGADDRDRPERRDLVAAQILLQEALDRGLTPMPPLSHPPAPGPEEAGTGVPMEEPA